MQENWIELSQAFSEKEESVLATIIETKGATYQKVGTMMLISAAGECSGLLSGGCLEADIAIHSQQVLLTGVSKILHYDLTGDADLLWGLGGGCEGEINILLQPLTPTNNHLAFGDMLSKVLAGGCGNYIQAIEADSEPFGQFISEADHPVEDLTANISQIDVSKVKERQLINIPIYPPISILICGAGPDAAPVCQFATQLGWKVALWDHRKAALEKSVFNQVHAKRKIRPENIGENELNPFEAIVVMTHNLENDQTYVQKAIASQVSYIGLLGPVARKNKILSNINVPNDDFSQRVYGPIGLDIGGRSPQAIALSIMAQVQQHLTKLKNTRQKKTQLISAGYDAL